MEAVEAVSNSSSLGVTLYEPSKTEPCRAILTLARGWQQVIFFHAVATFPDLEIATVSVTDVFHTWRQTGGVGVVAHCYANPDLWKQV